MRKSIARLVLIALVSIAIGCNNEDFLSDPADRPMPRKSPRYFLVSYMASQTGNSATRYGNFYHIGEDILSQDDYKDAACDYGSLALYSLPKSSVVILSINEFKDSLDYVTFKTPQGANLVTYNK